MNSDQNVEQEVQEEREESQKEETTTDPVVLGLQKIEEDVAKEENENNSKVDPVDIEEVTVQVNDAYVPTTTTTTTTTISEKSKDPMEYDWKKQPRVRTWSEFFAEKRDKWVVKPFTYFFSSRYMMLICLLILSTPLVVLDLVFQKWAYLPLHVLIFSLGSAILFQTHKKDQESQRAILRQRGQKNRLTTLV